MSQHDPIVKTDIVDLISLLRDTVTYLSEMTDNDALWAFFVMDHWRKLRYKMNGE